MMVFRSEPGQRGWRVTRNGGVISVHGTRKRAVDVAKRAALRMFASGSAVQLVLVRKDGSIQSERTYDHDPVKPRRRRQGSSPATGT